MEEKKDQRKLYILICFICIIVLSSLTYVRVNYLANFNINESFNNIDFPDEFTNFAMPFEIEVTGYEVFETESKDFKIAFPNNWDLKNGKALLTAMSGETTRPETDVIFLAYKLEGISGNISFLLIEETKKTDLQDVLNILNIEVEEGDEENSEDLIEEKISLVNAIIIEETDDLLLEMASNEEGGAAVHSYIKILTLEDKSYIVSLITFEHCWESEKDSFLEILSTTEIKKQKKVFSNNGV